MSRMWLVGLGGCVPHLYTQDGPIGPSTWEAPDNSWVLAEPPASLVAEGFAAGETAPDLRLVDQFGEEVSLWQFYGNVILVDVSTVWCIPCQALAEHTEETWQTYRERGLIYVTILQEDSYGGPAKQSDVQGWVDYFGITAPVLADGELAALDAVPVIGGSLAYPGVVLIGRDMKVIGDALAPADHVSVDEAVQDAL